MKEKKEKDNLNTTIDNYGNTKVNVDIVNKHIAEEVAKNYSNVSTKRSDVYRDVIDVSCFFKENDKDAIDVIINYFREVKMKI